MRIENTFTILDELDDIAKENNIDVWMASLDMKKVFDRIEFRPLFDALEYQGVPSLYIHLLKALYSGQHVYQTVHPNTLLHKRRYAAASIVCNQIPNF